jgi:EAL domain-containing protein (putative c-di-GMP-specific phosphodiesterase class I)
MATLSAVDWEVAIHRVASDPTSLRPVFQPIVDLRRGVVCGYEMLSRFPGPPEAPPNIWFREAESFGLRVELEATALELGLASLATLPANCFLTVNVDPTSLSEPAIRAVWERHSSLSDLVVELTEHTSADEEWLSRQIGELRERGAMVAVDDVGSGYSSLQRVSTQRPQFIKVGRELVAGIHGEPARREMIESLGAMANRLDAWLIAEGIEETSDLDTLMRIGVPLGQGFGLARPEGEMAGPELPLSDWIRANAASLTASRGGGRSRLWAKVEPLLIDTWESEAALRWDREPEVAHLPVVSGDDRPAGVAVRERYEHGDRELAPALCAIAGENSAYLAKRALARPPENRTHPIICCDEQGRYLGPISLESLVEALADDLIALERH